MIGSARHSWHHLSVITRLLAYSMWTRPHWREGLKCFLCSCLRGMHCCRFSGAIIEKVPRKCPISAQKFQNYQEEGGLHLFLKIPKEKLHFFKMFPNSPTMQSTLVRKDTKPWFSEKWLRKLSWQKLMKTGYGKKLIQSFWWKWGNYK